MTTQLVAVALGIVCLAGGLTVGPVAHRQRTPHRLPAVRVDAGRVDRLDSVVEIALPPSITGDSLQLRADDGTSVPLQIGKDRHAWFVLESLKAGDMRLYVIEPALDREERVQRVDAVAERDGLTLRVAQRPVLRYQADRSALPHPDIKTLFRRGGYLHPVRTPSGRIVTEDYPLAHLHHHGIWAAWAKTAFQGRTPDFWNMGDGTGAVEFESLIDTWSGRVQAGFKARHRYVDLTAPRPTTVLTEDWNVILYGVGLGVGPGQNPPRADTGTDGDGRPRRPRTAAAASYRMFDLVLTQELVTSSPLVLPQFQYGGVAFHGPRSWDGPAGAQVLTSEGKTRSNGDTTRARWCYIGGLVDGARAGLVMFSHPQNIRAPQPVRMYPEQPFLNFAPTQAGRLDITPSQPYLARYRFVTIDGPPDVPTIERLWRDYAEPVRVEILPGAAAPAP